MKYWAYVTINIIIALRIEAQTINEQLTREIQKEDQKLTGGKIQYTIELGIYDPELISNESPRVAFEDPSTSYTLTFKGDKVRWEYNSVMVFKTQRVPIKSIYAFDGTKTTSLTQPPLVSSAGELSVYTVGSIKPGKFAVGVDVREYGLTRLGKPLSQYIAEQSSARMGGQEIIGGNLCEKLIITDNARTIKIWVDQEYGYRMRKLESEAEDVLVKIEVEDFQQIGGIWWPKQGVWEIYKKGNLIEKRHLHVQGVTVPDNIPDSYFEIEFPSGTSVFDYRTGTNFMVK
jgi:hypothetical protein